MVQISSQVEIIVKEVTDSMGIRKDRIFQRKPKTESAMLDRTLRNAADTYELPVADKLNGFIQILQNIVFGLNASYVRR
jgi:DNA mismatch repair protein MutH